MAREVKPNVGDSVRYVLWPDYDEPKNGVVTQLLSSQFVILSEAGYTHYKFYRDHGAEWKVTKTAEEV